ncbi:hypothetical protein QYE76_030865 [Lolium multiflorum]|uniref:CCHC-type domain-containing protein n=1 Tax=Lolium multiflorum TaxID=4521 RepID=A0AAD8QR47_LOLMU|nr:hypothetical protein QYE76_030865 [Lolium multiflorum]
MENYSVLMGDSSGDEDGGGVDGEAFRGHFPMEGAYPKFYQLGKGGDLIFERDLDSVSEMLGRLHPEFHGVQINDQPGRELQWVITADLRGKMEPPTSERILFSIKENNWMDGLARALQEALARVCGQNIAAVQGTRFAHFARHDTIGEPMALSSHPVLKHHVEHLDYMLHETRKELDNARVYANQTHMALAHHADAIKMLAKDRKSLRLQRAKKDATIARLRAKILTLEATVTQQDQLKELEEDGEDIQGGEDFLSDDDDFEEDEFTDEEDYEFLESGGMGSFPSMWMKMMRSSCTSFTYVGPARAWWTSTRAMNAGQIMTWADFKLKFSKYHVPPGLIKKMRDEFRELKQGRMSVVEYRDRFSLCQALSRAPANNNPNNSNTAPRTGSNAIPITPKDKATITCYECGIVGHYSNECPKRLAKIAANTSAPAQQQRRVTTGKKFTPNNPNNRSGRLFHMSAEEAQEAPDVVLGVEVLPPSEGLEPGYVAVSLVPIPASGYRRESTRNHLD